MPTRDQLTQERLDALIEVLVANGVIDRGYADSLEMTRDLGHGAEVVEAAHNGRGPPDFANNNRGD